MLLGTAVISFIKIGLLPFINKFPRLFAIQLTGAHNIVKSSNSSSFNPNKQQMLPS